MVYILTFCVIPVQPAEAATISFTTAQGTSVQQARSYDTGTSTTDLVVNGTVTLTANADYRNITVNPGGILILQTQVSYSECGGVSDIAPVIRANGTVINNGTVRGWSPRTNSPSGINITAITIQNAGNIESNGTGSFVAETITTAGTIFSGTVTCNTFSATAALNGGTRSFNIYANTASFTAINAGRVSIQATTVTGSSITTGPGGNIDITAKTANIPSLAAGSGETTDGGSVTINTVDPYTVNTITAGDGGAVPTSEGSIVYNPRSGGSISITAPSMTLGSLKAGSGKRCDAWNITYMTGAAPGGNVTLTSTGTISSTGAICAGAGSDSGAWYGNGWPLPTPGPGGDVSIRCASFSLSSINIGSGGKINHNDVNTAVAQSGTLSLNITADSAVGTLGLGLPSSFCGGFLGGVAGTQPAKNITIPANCSLKIEAFPSYGSSYAGGTRLNCTGGSLRLTGANFKNDTWLANNPVMLNGTSLSCAHITSSVKLTGENTIDLSPYNTLYNQSGTMSTTFAVERYLEDQGTWTSADTCQKPLSGTTSWQDPNTVVGKNTKYRVGYKLSSWNSAYGYVYNEQDETQYVNSPGDRTVMTVTGITLNRHSKNLAIQSSTTLSAAPVPANAIMPSVTWSSNQPSVATVSNTGVVTAVAAGTAIITATTQDGTFSDSCSVNVVPTMYTKLLLHMDDPPDSTGHYPVFTDETDHAVTTIGTVTSAANPAKFGRSAGFNGNGAYLSLPGSPDWNFGSGDFTIETWVQFSPSSDGTQNTIISQGNSSDSTYWQLNVNRGPGQDNGLWFRYRASGGGYFDFYKTGFTWNTNTWYHVAVTRKGANWHMFVNGTKVVSPVQSTNLDANFSMPDLGGPLTVGALYYSGSTQQYLNGNLDELRIIKGIARWMDDFTPLSDPYESYKAPGSVTLNQHSITLTGGNSSTLTAVVAADDTTDPTVIWSSSNPNVAIVSDTGVVTGVGAGNATITVTTRDGRKTDTCSVIGNAVTQDQYTKVLMHMDGTDAGTAFTESCGKNVTRFGDTCTMTGQKKFGTGSARFDGSGDYLTIPGSPDLCLDGDFTVECWAYQTVTGPQCLLDYGNPSEIHLTTSNGVPSAYCKGTTLTASAAITPNAWHHWALIRSNGYVQLYVDGTAVGSSVYNNTVVNSAFSPIIIGVCSNGAYSFNGYIDEFRVSKGIARWTGNFLPPSQPYIDPGVTYIVTGITLDRHALTLTAGGVGQILNAEVLPANASSRTVRWSSSNPAVASVLNGVVTPHAAGTATITAAADQGGFTDTCTVTVVNNAEDDQTKLLLHMDGADNGAVFTDTCGKPVTVGGSAATRAETKFGGTGSGYFAGNNGAWLNLADSPDWDLAANGSYTVDTWVYFPAQVTGTLWSINNKINCFVYQDGLTAAQYGGLPEDGQGGKTSAYPGLNTWHHLALVNNNGVKTLYLDGIAQPAVTGGTETPRTDGVYIGKRGDEANPLSGPVYFDEFRISSGVARWTGNFVPPSGAYGDPGAAAAVTGLSLDRNELTMTPASPNVNLMPAISPVNAANTALDWTSSNPAIASVADGVITAGQTGTAVITAKTQDGGFSAACTVNVMVTENPVTTVTLDQHTLSLTAGGQGVTLNAAVLPAEADLKDIVWLSDNPAVVAVNGGEVVPVGAGTTSVSAISLDGGLRDTCTVIVAGDNTIVPVSGVSLDRSTLSMTVGETAALLPTVAPANAANKGILWSSSDPNIAAVSQTGLVTAVALGTTTVMVETQDGNRTATCIVNVTKLPVTPVESFPVLLMHMDDPYFTDLTGKSVTQNGYPTLSSSDKKFGTACGYFSNGDGNYLSVNLGSDANFGNDPFTIDYWFKPSINDQHGHWLLRVVDANGTCRMGTYYSMQDGWFGCNIENQNNNGGAGWLTNGVNWYHAAIVKVNATTVKVFVNGVEKAAYPLETVDWSNCTLYLGGLERNSSLIDEVRIVRGLAAWTGNFTPPTAPYPNVQANVPLTGVSLDQHAVNLTVGQTANLTAALAPANSTSKAVKWTSSDPGKVTVSAAGTVAAIAPGTVTIRAASILNEAVYDQCTVTVAAGTDQYTRLLMHLDGADNGTLFTDECGYAVTRKGNAVTRTAQKKWTASAYFGGTADSLTIADNEAWSFGSGDFTLDFWVYPTRTDTQECLASQWVTGDTAHEASFAILHNKAGVNPGKLWFLWKLDGLNGMDDGGTSIPISVNQWNHIALIRNGGTLYAAVNGTMYLLAENLGNQAFDNCARALAFGSQSDEAQPFQGYLDEIRLSKGIARWTANFTPLAAPYPNPDAILAVTAVTLDQHTMKAMVGQPVSLHATVTPANRTDKSILWTSSDPGKVKVSAAGLVTPVAAGTATIKVSSAVYASVYDTCVVTVTGALDPNTALLLHMDGTDNGTEFTDQYGKTVTANGNAVTTTQSPKFGTASAAIRGGTGDFLSIADDADFDGTGDMTVDTWIRIDRYGFPICGRLSPDNSSGWGLFVRENGKIGLINAGQWTVESSGTVPLNTWIHIAMTRESGIVKIWMNGILQGSWNGALDNNDLGFSIGSGSPAAQTNPAANGYIDEFRFSKGIARWNADFTPPSQAYGAAAEPTAAGSVNGTSAFIYTADDSIASVVLPDGRTLHCEYDENGNLIAAWSTQVQ